jgi:hypothetical protein
LTPISDYQDSFGSWPALELIEKAVSESAPNEICRKMRLYISQAKGYSLKEIGEYFNIKSAAVSQSNLRFKYRIKNKAELKKIKDKIEKRLASKLWIAEILIITGGAEGDRTLDLMNAIHALSQLSYGPTLFDSVCG